jgi:hypothetical protein
VMNGHWESSGGSTIFRKHGVQEGTVKPTIDSY